MVGADHEEASHEVGGKPDVSAIDDGAHRRWYAGKNVLVTGGLGFIGSNLARELVTLGARVTLLDALLPDYGGNRFNVAGLEDRLEVVVVDVRDREAKIGRAHV